jgi:glycosyltransferase involved in cell wall biosynthesis
LILSFFYHPEPNDVKAHALARDLVARGHDVTAITTFPNYPDGKIYPGYKQAWRTREIKDGVQVVRVPLYPDHSRSSLKRALSYLSFMTSASLLGPFLSGRADVMWVYQPPLTTGIAGWWMSKLRRAPYVYEIQDMWPDTLSATGMIDNRRALAAVGWAAKRIYRRAAAISVIAPGMKANLIEKGIAADKVHVIPNWADEVHYFPTERDPALGEQHALDGKFNVIFGGNMGPAQGLRTVIEAAVLLRDMEDVQFVLIGDGLELDDLRAQVRARGLHNVRFIDRQPPEAMPGFFAWADALLVHLTDDALFSITIPSKTMAYLAVGRPVICAVNGDGADVIRNASAGLTCPPGDASALAEAVRALYSMPPTAREALGQSGRQTYVEQYRREIAVDRYEAIFEDIKARRGKRAGRAQPQEESTG